LTSGSAGAACTRGAAAAAPLSLYMKTEHVTVTIASTKCKSSVVPKKAQESIPVNMTEAAVA